MTSQYLNHLYSDLLSNSPQTVTIDIPADMGIGIISQVVTKQGAVFSDWHMNYYSDTNVQGIGSEDYVQMLFCLNEGVSWSIADQENLVFIEGMEKWRGFVILQKVILTGLYNFCICLSGGIFS